MVNTLPFQRQQPLALATSQIHRSRSLPELQKAFFAVMPKFVRADAYGIYLFDDKLNTRTVVTSHRVGRKFLQEYEDLRADDPLFSFLLQKKQFTHSLDVCDEKDWLDLPLHDFLSRWGLDYSIEAPLILDGRVAGTLNFAIGGKRYFGKECIVAARFLCNEFDYVYKRISQFETLKDELEQTNANRLPAKPIPKRTQEVLDLVVLGLSNRAISERLGISENTVRHHIKNMYRLLNVHNRAQLTRCVYAGHLPSDDHDPGVAVTPGGERHSM